jgi:cohesin complex subunit SCC1
MLSHSQIKEQLSNRDNIIRPQSSFAHDPYIAGLMDIHNNGGFVNNILFESRSDGRAPELKGLLSLGSIRPNELKRKRDSRVADMHSGGIKCPKHGYRSAEQRTLRAQRMMQRFDQDGQQGD